MRRFSVSWLEQIFHIHTASSQERSVLPLSDRGLQSMPLHILHKNDTIIDNAAIELGADIAFDHKLVVSDKEPFGNPDSIDVSVRKRWRWTVVCVGL